MFFQLSALIGLVMALLSAGTARSDNLPDLQVLRDATKAAIESDTPSASFVYHGVLPSQPYAPSFWALVQQLEGPGEAGMSGLLDAHLTAQMASELMPSCRTPYEALARKIEARSGDQSEEELDLLAADIVRRTVSRPAVLDLVDAARHELILMTDLTCKILAKREDHAMTAVSALRLLGDAPVPTSPKGSRQADHMGTTCQTVTGGGFP